MESELLSCPVCYERFNQHANLPRVILVCGHTICSSCLKILLKTSGQASCPLDKKKFQFPQIHVEHFPVNFIAKQLAETRKEKELCGDHNEKIRYICLTDKSKVCDTCIWDGKHKGHEIKPTKIVQREVDSKVKEIKGLLEKLEIGHSNIGKMMKERRNILLKTIKERFEEMRYLLNTKELEMSFDVNSFFNIERERVDTVMGVSSSLREKLTKKISDLENVLKNGNFFKNENLFNEIQERIGYYSSKLNQGTIQAQTDQMVKELEETLHIVDKSLFTQIEVLSGFLNELKVPFSSFLDNFISTFSEDNIINFQWKPNFRILAQKARTRFTFLQIGADLIISNDTFFPEEIALKFERWKAVKQVKVDIRQPKLDKEDVQTLIYVLKQLDQAYSLELQFKPGTITEEIFEAIFAGRQNFTALSIDMRDYQICEQSLEAKFIERVLSRMIHLDSLTLDLKNTTITNGTLKKIIQNGILPHKNLRYLLLYLENAFITDECIEDLCVPLPTVESFSLDLSNTEITDKSIELFTKNTLSSMKNLDALTLVLQNTKVTDVSVKPLVSMLKNVKKLNLDLSWTDITNISVEELAKTLSDSWGNMEKFMLDIGATEVSDIGVIRFFNSMPKVKDFVLGLYETDISDISIKTFAKNTLASMEELEFLSLDLEHTKITDYGLQQVFANMKDVREVYLNLGSTSVSDYSVEPFIRDHAKKMKNLEEFGMNVMNTWVSEDVHDQIEEFILNL